VYESPALQTPLDQQSFDSGIPNVARIYDALLGGTNNYAADREVAISLTTAIPDAPRAARDNRAFLGRAVRFLAGDADIRQFVDIGTGLPVGGHVHQIAQAANSAARVIYADNDPVVVAHARALIADTPAVAAVEGDVRFPRDLLALPAVQDMIDFEQPVAVLLVAILHFVADYACPWLAVRCIVDHLAPGSYLVISHVTSDEIPAETISRALQIYDSAYVRGAARGKSDIERFFDSLEMIPPGLVDVSAWRSPHRSQPSRSVLFYAGIGRKPGGTPGSQP
jgi:hypothetical protein